MNDQELAYMIASIAEYSFWDTVASKCPDIVTGDLDPTLAIEFSELCNQVVFEWIKTNRKDV